MMTNRKMRHRKTTYSILTRNIMIYSLMTNSIITYIVTTHSIMTVIVATLIAVYKGSYIFIVMLSFSWLSDVMLGGLHTLSCYP
jgi:hypothetical protein